VAVVGVQHGYEGLVKDECVPMDAASVGGIISMGGTILRSARSLEFRERAGREVAMANLRKRKIEGLVVIGGDGSLTGAYTLAEEFGFPVMGVPGSIDNDIAGTDYSIGFDTAVNTAVEAIDRIRDTAYSHDRVFVIEVMGRRNGFIAIEAGLAGGAEAVLIPEVPLDLARVCSELASSAKRGKLSSIIVVAEGAARAADVKAFLEKQTGYEARDLVLGHMQRGGSPTAFDRVLALKLGAFATRKLLEGHSGEMAGVEGVRLVSQPLGYVLGTTTGVDRARLELIRAMSI
jgi:6-phosphofructokinase 1